MLGGWGKSRKQEGILYMHTYPLHHTCKGGPPITCPSTYKENEALKVKSHLVNYVSLPREAMWFSGHAMYPETLSQDAIYPSLWQKLLPQTPSKTQMKRLVT